jgi:hypothetical protein
MGNCSQAVQCSAQGPHQLAPGQYSAVHEGLTSLHQGSTVQYTGPSPACTRARRSQTLPQRGRTCRRGRKAAPAPLSLEGTAWQQHARHAVQGWRYCMGAKQHASTRQQVLKMGGTVKQQNRARGCGCRMWDVRQHGACQTVSRRRSEQQGRGHIWLCSVYNLQRCTLLLLAFPVVLLPSTTEQLHDVVSMPGQREWRSTWIFYSLYLSQFQHILPLKFGAKHYIRPTCRKFGGIQQGTADQPSARQLHCSEADPGVLCGVVSFAQNGPHSVTPHPVNSGRPMVAFCHHTPGSHSS